MDLIKRIKTKMVDKDYFWIFPILSTFIVRIIDLTKSSIWHDEGFTMWIIRYNPIEIISKTIRDVHPPAYYLMAKIWTFVFGDSVFAIRFLSLLFSIATIFIVYKIVEAIWNRKAAFWSSMVIAFSPMLLSLAQEARMYSMVTFFITFAVFCFIKYLKTKNHNYLLMYVPAMAIAMYTQYYSFFAIISLWLIMLVLTPEILRFKWTELIKKSTGIFDYKWWLANIALVVLYIPWFGVAYEQVTRVGISYWIRPEWITAKTIPNSVLQFFTYGHLDQLNDSFFGLILYWTIVFLLIFSGLILLVKKEKRKVLLPLYIYGYLPMILVYIYSKLKTPIYQDRYFIFSSLAIFIIWGCLLASIKNKKVKLIIISISFIVLAAGCVAVRNSENHKMRQVVESIVRIKQKDDLIVSGSLYTFLDSSYYFGYGNIKYLSNSVDGYGETSLFYDNPEIYMVSPDSISSPIKRIWIVSRSGEDYIDKIIDGGWKQIQKIEDGGIKALLYTRI